jgi:glycine oxidase
MAEFLIIGGGVIGLSLAYELARRGRAVQLVDRRQPGREASWAAAGLLPPPSPGAVHDAVDRLRALSHVLYAQWSAALQQETGIDTGYRRCGALCIARRSAEAASLKATVAQFQHDGVEVEELDLAQLEKLEPALCDGGSSRLRAVYLLPGEAQIRTPRLLQALTAACQLRHVEIGSEVTVEHIHAVSGRVMGVHTSAGVLRADQYCLTAGPWTQELLTPLGWSLPMEPWRGQMLLWKVEPMLLSHIVYEGLRYLVPRGDGHLLAGSTMERAGFACHTTGAALEELKSFSLELLPALRDRQIVKSWAGLRPGTADGLPFLARVPGIDNLTVAAGHFRSGIHLAPSTALLLTQLLCGETPEIDLAPFRLNR